MNTHKMTEHNTGKMLSITACLRKDHDRQTTYLRKRCGGQATTFDNDNTQNSTKVAQQIKDPVLLRKIAMQLKQLRRERDITQDIFFYDTNIHIARIETGKVNPSVSTLKAICNYFEISLVDFFDQVEAM
jgi:DNA-binding XRE family transcriptional regulator